MKLISHQPSILGTLLGDYWISIFIVRSQDFGGDILVVRPSRLVDKIYIEDIIRWREDMKKVRLSALSLG